MLQLLRQPYPVYFNTRQNLLICVLAGVFVALFLILFQPFGLQEWQQTNKELLLSGYGLITLILMMAWRLLHLLYNRHDRQEQWTVGKEIFSILTLITAIAVANFLYSSWIGFARLDAAYFWGYLRMTFMVGIFPAILIPLFNYMRKLQQHSQTSQQLNQQINTNRSHSPEKNLAAIRLIAENEKDFFEYPLSCLYYISAADNYATIFYQLPDQRLGKEMIRSSLNRLEDQLGNSPVKRCHRSFLANIQLVTHTSGNAQGYKLHFENESLPPVPLSRKYAPVILSLLADKA